MSNKKLNFDRLNDQALHYLKDLVQNWFPGGIFEGNEYKTLNPNRNDQKIGSFSINIRTGNWCDFADEDNPDSKGTTALSLYEYYNNKNGKSIYQCAIELAELVNYRAESFSSQPPPKKPMTNRDLWKPIIPIPDTAPPFPKQYPKYEIGSTTPTLYDINYVFPFVDTENKTIGYVCRIEYVNGTKDTIPLTYCKNTQNGSVQWRFREMPDPRPLFNQYRIVKNPTLHIIVVEGEKKAKRLQEFFDEYSIPIIVTSWIGGVRNAKKANWGLLSGRKITIWPDNDTHKYKGKHPQSGKLIEKINQPGFLAAINVFNILMALKCSVKIVDPPYTEKPDGWDCYDAIEKDKFSITQLQDFIKNRLINPLNSNTVSSGDEIKTHIDNTIKFLGYQNDTNYFMRADTKELKKFTATQLTINNIIDLADLDYWRSIFPGKKDNSVDWQEAVNYLINMSKKAGRFDPTKKRGRGAWIDDNRVVVHLGDRLIVNGELTDIDKIKSKYIYEYGDPIDEQKIDPLTDEKSHKLLEISHLLNWEHDLHPYLLAGQITLGPICGALNWRPNTWLTGSSGSGKTWSITNILKPVIGPFVMHASNGVSAASIRYTLQSDALFVIIDESESNNEKSKTTLESIFEMARASCVESGAKVYKATQNQTVKQYETRSMFCFASVNVSMHESADTSRTMILSLKANKGDPKNNQKFKALQEMVKETITSDWCVALRTRTISLIPVIRKNCEIFSDVISDITLNRRYGDQIGTLIAGAMSLETSNVFTHAEARDFIKNFNIENVNESSANTDELNLLNVILEQKIRITNNKEYTIAEMIEIVITSNSNSFGNPDEDKEEFKKILRRYGINVEYKNSWIMYISDSHKAIAQILEKTQWARGWGRILSRYDGAIKVACMRYAGNTTRATGIPCKSIFNL